MYWVYLVGKNGLSYWTASGRMATEKEEDCVKFCIVLAFLWNLREVM